MVRHGLTVARLVAASGGEVTAARSLNAATGPHDLTHAQFTDALYAADIASVCDAVPWSARSTKPSVREPSPTSRVTV
ncbi:MAG: hypothetical protein M3486_10565 [Actinomycetota bacterium]|nr:hypothetical protein [Actinomycetota bacterium]